MEQNKVRKYILYAFGEIFLVVIGILIALYVNNKNEEQQIDNVFRTQIEEIYNSINFDVARYKDLNEYRIQRRNQLEFILNSDSLQQLNKDQQIMALYGSTTNFDEYNSETSYFLSKLSPNPDNKIQNDLVRVITGYVNRLDKNLAADNTAFNMIRNSGIPYPSPDPELPMSFKISPDYYNQANYDQLESLYRNEKFIAEMKNLSVGLLFDFFEYRVRIGQGEYLLKLIKETYPDIQIAYQDVGIIGTSIDGFDDVGAISTPMKDTYSDGLIWEIELYLKKGRVKFRTRDSWAENWGGNTFPSGEADFEGLDIPVDEPGLYHITLDLKENVYNFEKLDD